MSTVRTLAFAAFVIATNSHAMVNTLHAAEPLAGTQPLTVEGDLASQMVDGIDKFSAAADRRIGSAPPGPLES